MSLNCGATKIANLQIHFMIKQQVRWLEIAVNNASPMKEMTRPKQLDHNEFRLGLR